MYTAPTYTYVILACLQSKVSASLLVAYFESLAVYSILLFVFAAVLAYKLATCRPTL